MKHRLLIILSLLFTLSTFAQSPADAFANDLLHRNANISLLVSDLSSGAKLHQHRAEKVAIPASTMKLVTTATALEILGPTYRFTTTLETDGNIQNGILHGNLYIRGSGDPTLGSAKMGDIHFLEKWVDAVKKAGIREIKGDIIADASIYDSEGINPKWMWEDLGNYYAAGAYGISYKDNTYFLELKSGAVGTRPEILKVTPNIPELKFDNRLASTTIRFDSAYIYGAPNSNERTIYGAIPANRASFTIKGDIPNPGLVLARDFAWKLKSSGVAVSGSATDQVKTGNRNSIYTHQSPPLSEIIREINVTSNNHYTELLFRHLALQRSKVATTNHAIRVVQDFWRLKGLPINELKMHDGSGLSPMNAVSAQFFVNLLQYMSRSVHGHHFQASLPTAGSNGTVRNFLRGSALSGKVLLKSGSIGGVRAYAGYINSGGKRYAFAMIVNHPNATSTAPTTRKMEEFLLKIAP